MRIRIYYKPDASSTDTGRITGIVVINDDDWNLAEIINDGDDTYATFELTEDNINRYMDGPDVVNMEAIKEVEWNL